jgi:hypothetical protein
MAKNHEAGRLISPTNLWGKPLTRPPGKPAKEKVTGMRTEDEEDFTDEDEIDVDAELAEEDENAEELVDETPDEAEDSEIIAEAEEEDATEEEGDVEDDGLAYAPEDGDEIAAEGEDDVVSAVDADDEDEDESGETDETEVAETTPESRKHTMSDKKKVSLSDHIRNEIEKRKASGASLRGVDIVGALEKRSISVSPAQVSQLLKKAGIAGAKRGRKPAETATEQPSEKSRVAMKAKKNGVEAQKKPLGLKRNAPPAPVAAQPRSALKAAPSASGRFSVPVDQLKAAEAFVSACGGFEKATRILTTAAELSNAFNG